MGSDLSWIKLSLNIFDDEKIKIIETMPEHDAILLCWVRLLVQAGKSNAAGYLLISDSIPFTDEMLAATFRMPLNTVRLALGIFEKFGMIELVNSTICLPNWEKYQATEGMEKIRLANRERKQIQRERQKLLGLARAEQDDCDMSRDMSRDSHVTVTPCHALDTDRDIEEEVSFSSVSSDTELCPSPEATDPAQGSLFEAQEAMPLEVPKKRMGGPERLARLWNECTKDTPLQKVVDLSSVRVQKARLRLQERPLSQWEEVFRRIAASRFCKGYNSSGWRASFDWIIKNDLNAVKVLEGKYGGENGQPPKGPSAAPPHRPVVGNSPTAGAMYDKSHLW